MLKFKSHCPICEKEITVDILNGRIQAPCGHRLRIQAKRNGWICCIFAFFLAITSSKLTHVWFEKIPAGALFELVVALLTVIVSVAILYHVFGFDNVYHVKERK